MQLAIAILLVIIFPLLVDVITILYIFKNQKISQSKKLLWILLVCLLPMIGAIGYFMYLKSSQNMNLKKH